MSAWTEMDFVTVLAEAYPAFKVQRHLETNAHLAKHFPRSHAGASASAHAVIAADGSYSDQVRREHALEAIAHLARIVESIDLGAAA